MIPADVASSLRLLLPNQQGLTDRLGGPQATLPAQRIIDVLGELTPGQRLFAEIQAPLPNGAYRAMIAQREVILSLPFSAKPGDSLELEVVDSDNGLVLAITGKHPQTEETQSGSVTTNLSRTGQLIGDLLNGIDAPGKRAQPALLNRNEPLLQAIPIKGADIAPVLKQAITQSGMFYEAHQARWVSGELPTTALLQEPQGKLSPRQSELAQTNEPTVLATPKENNSDPSAQVISHSATTEPLTEQIKPSLPSVDEPVRMASSPPDSPANTSGNLIHNSLTPLVQQQLDALATQNFAWQGQIWPGQNLSWEIEENRSGNNSQDANSQINWRTRLKLTLPKLGEVSATLCLTPAGTLDIALTADTQSAQNSLQSAQGALLKQLEQNNLILSAFTVQDAGTE